MTEAGAAHTQEESAGGASRCHLRSLDLDDARGDLGERRSAGTQVWETRDYEPTGGDDRRDRAMAALSETDAVERLRQAVV